MRLSTFHCRREWSLNEGRGLSRFVLIEDSAQDIELTIAALTKARLANEVIMLRDGEEALEYLCCRGRHEMREKGNPALVLLDIKLPKVDGLEVLAYVKRDPELKSTPVVMLTTSQERRTWRRAMSSVPTGEAGAIPGLRQGGSGCRWLLGRA
ncbi:MAG: response regulator [Bryobacteraceae bacterium]